MMSPVVADRATPTTPPLDFAADPEVACVVAEGERLAFGHLVNPAFAVESGRILAVHPHRAERKPPSSCRARPVNSVGPADPRRGMHPRQHTAKQLTQTLVAVLTRCRHRASKREWDAIEETLRRLKEHERLVGEVLPDLRNRLPPAEGA
jgi:hypothetical protein